MEIEGIRKTLRPGSDGLFMLRKNLLKTVSVAHIPVTALLNLFAFTLVSYHLYLHSAWSSMSVECKENKCIEY